MVDTLRPTEPAGRPAPAAGGAWPAVAIAHDYLTQRGGAERVVVALAGAFPGAPVYTSLYEPGATYPEFRSLDVRTSLLDRVPGARRHHRLAFPLLAPAMRSVRIDAEVTVCSSSGWAHGVRTTGKKVVYCHAPARWLYQPERYLQGLPPIARPALALLAPWLLRLDRRAAAAADRYLANSTAVARQVESIYGVDVEVVPPPLALDPGGAGRMVDGVEPGYVLCVSRLLAYKNVGAVVDAFAALPGERLVVVGDGPLRRDLLANAPANVTFVGKVDDAQLRWLYGASSALISASFEDFGLSPVEAAAFGKPSAVLRFGGFLDTLVEGETGVYVERPDPAAIADALRRLRRARFDPARLMAHASRYAPDLFADRIRSIVHEVATGRG
jgi:glycosyltransferase involved in cell wall biosynthesis